MFVTLQIVSVLLVAVAMALSAAHALELPGKLRLDREHYNATQSIYYPAFTITGLVGEAGGLGATLLLALVTPAQSASLGWTVVGFVALSAMHGAYWTITHPANQFWLVRATAPSIAPVGFFATHPLPRPPMAAAGWSRLRSRWEYSHILRAVLGGVSLLALVIGLAID
jgi:hypothetical protein